MQKIIFQVPVDKQLKETAEKVATKQGFSSLQELVRVFLTQLASNKVEVTLEKSVTLSSKNEKRYIQMTEDFKSEKNISSADNFDNLIHKLNEN